MAKKRTPKRKTKGTAHQQTLTQVPDISVEYWGTYEVPILETYSEDKFRDFVVEAYGGRVSTGGKYIHGFKQEMPLFVGSSKQGNLTTKDDVVNFAKEIAETKGKRNGTMIAWSFAPAARKAAEKLMEEGNPGVDLIQISITTLESDEFRKHITKLQAEGEYESFLKFILPPQVNVDHKRVSSMTYEFTAESQPLNTGAKIVNIQWDFDYLGRFTPTQGHGYGRDSKGNPTAIVEYKFKHIGKTSIACRVQDDVGGEKIYSETVDVR